MTWDREEWGRLKLTARAGWNCLGCVSPVPVQSGKSLMIDDCDRASARVRKVGGGWVWLTMIRTTMIYLTGTPRETRPTGACWERRAISGKERTSYTTTRQRHAHYSPYMVCGMAPYQGQVLITKGTVNSRALRPQASTPPATQPTGGNNHRSRRAATMQTSMTHLCVSNGAKSRRGEKRAATGQAAPHPSRGAAAIVRRRRRYLPTYTSVRRKYSSVKFRSAAGRARIC